MSRSSAFVSNAASCFSFNNEENSDNEEEVFFIDENGEPGSLFDALLSSDDNDGE